MVNSSKETFDDINESLLPDSAFENTLRLAKTLHAEIVKFITQFDHDLSLDEALALKEITIRAAIQNYFFRKNLNICIVKSTDLLQVIEKASINCSSGDKSATPDQHKLKAAQQQIQIDELQTITIELLEIRKMLELQWSETRYRML